MTRSRDAILSSAIAWYPSLTHTGVSFHAFNNSLENTLYSWYGH